MNDKEIAAFHKASRDDDREFMSGRLTEKKFWDRVHARDRKVRAMSPADRRLINDTACRCSFCRKNPR